MAELWRRLEPTWEGRREGARDLALLEAARAAALASSEAPAAGFVAADRFGDAVACSFTMNALFGSGRMPPDSGLLLAAAPKGPPLLTVALRGNENTGRLRYAAASGGPLALAEVTLDVMAAERPLEEALAAPRPWLEGAATRQEPADGSAPAHVSALYCPDGLVGEEERAKCRVANDPRGHGLAAVAR